MPGRHCAVAICKNNSRAVKLHNENIVFHRFPKDKDLVSKTTREEWIRRCRRADKFNADTSQICSVHFCKTDYERDLQNELLNLPVKRKLKKNSIPTLHLGVEKKKSASAVRRNARAAVKQRKLVVKEILNSNTVVPCADFVSRPEFVSCEEFESPVKNEDEDSNQDWKEKYQQLLTDYKELERKYEELEKKYEQGTKDLLIMQKKIHSQNMYYKYKILNINTSNQPHPFNKVFSQNHKNLILKKRKRVSWKE